MILLLVRVTCVSALNMDEIPDIPAEVPENSNKKGDKKRRDTYSAPEDAEGMST